MCRRVTLFLCMICALALTSAVSANSGDRASDSFKSGQTLLTKADFKGALKAFRAAATADPKTAEYTQQYAMLRQILKMRKSISSEEDNEKWSTMASALRTFYHDHHLYALALPLDQERHRRLASAESVVLLGETQLALGLESEAVELLGSPGKGQLSPRSVALYGLALARLERTDEAKVLATQLGEQSFEAEPKYYFDLACLQALTGDPASSLVSLVKAFEQTPPSRLDALRTQATKCEGLAASRELDGFALVLRTASKVKESDCSKGAGCGNCPKRAKCGSQAATAAKTDP